MAKLTLDLLDGGKPLLLNLDFLVQADTDALYLAIANDLSDLNNTATARTNIGLVAGGVGDIWVEKAGDTLTGALTLSDQVDALKSSNYEIQMESGVANGATAVGYIFDTTNTLSTTGYIHSIWKNNGTEQMSLKNTGGYDHLYLLDRIVIGDASPAEWTALSIQKTGSPTGFGEIATGMDFLSILDSTAVLGQGIAVQLHSRIDTAAAATTTSVAFRLTSEQNASQALSAMWGIQLLLKNNSSTGSPGTVKGFDVNQINWNGTAPSTFIGFNTVNGGISGMTSSTGIQIAKQSGATNNYGIILDGDSGGADIVFGAGKDASILYDGTDLVIAPALVGSGVVNISTAGTALGSVLATIGNIPAGATAAQNEWLKIKVNGNIRYIPCWA